MSDLARPGRAAQGPTLLQIRSKAPPEEDSQCACGTHVMEAEGAAMQRTGRADGARRRSTTSCPARCLGARAHLSFSNSEDVALIVDTGRQFLSPEAAGTPSIQPQQDQHAEHRRLHSPSRRGHASRCPRLACGARTAPCSGSLRHPKLRHRRDTVPNHDPLARSASRLR